MAYNYFNVTPNVALRDRGYVDQAIAQLQGLNPAQVNQYAQELSNNVGGVSFQEIQSRLAQGAAQGGGGATAGGGGGGGYGRAAYDPNRDQGRINQLRGDLGNYINQIRGVYGALFGDLDNITNEKKSNLNKQYGEQRTDLDKTYQDTSNQLGMAYAAQGVGDSSYKNKGLAKAADTYKKNETSLTDSYNNNIASIGQNYATTRAGFQSGLDAIGRIDPNAYGTVSDLNGAVGQLQGNLSGLNQQRAGFGTQSDYAKAIAGIAPLQQSGSAALKQQLAALAGAGAPQFAKQQVAGTLIDRAGGTPGETPNFWQDYFQKLVASQSPQAT